MAKDHPTIHGSPWEYTFPLPHLDIQGDFRTQPPGRLSRMVGVDGRYAGRLKRFPGFLKKYAVDLDTQSITVGSQNGTTTFFKPFVILRSPNSSELIRGVVFLGYTSSGGDDTDKIFAVFHDTFQNNTVSNPAAIKSFTVNTAVNYLDAAFDHQTMYFTGELNASPTSKIEFLARYAGQDAATSWVTMDWESTPLSLADDVLAVADAIREGDDSAESFLRGGTQYGIAYRIVYPEQGWFGPLTIPGVLEITGELAGGLVGTAAGYVRYGNSSPGTSISIPNNAGNVFSRAIVQMFRTVHKEFEEPATARGILHLESEWEVPRKSTIGPGAGTALTGSLDEADMVSTTRITVGGGAVAIMQAGDYVYIVGEVFGATKGDFRGVCFRRLVTSISGNDLIFTPAITNWWTGGGSTVATWYGSRSLEKSGDDDDDTAGEFVLDELQPRWGWGLGLGTGFFDAPTGVEDYGLAQQPTLEPDELSTFKKGNPRSKFISLYEDLFVRVTPSSSQEDAAEQDVLRWDFVEKIDGRKGLVPVQNRRRVADLSERVLNLVNVGPFLVVVLNNGLLRIHRSGSRLAIDTIHNRHGAGGKDGAVAVGSVLYMTSPVGLLAADLFSGQLDVLNATQHFFDERQTGSEVGHWRDDLADIQAAYDARLGAVVLLNPTRFEMLLVYLNHGTVGHLIDCPWDNVVSSVDLVSGGIRRAVFFNSQTAGLYEINADRSADSYTTFSFAADGNETSSGLTYNGTGTSAGSLSQVVHSGAAYQSAMVGHFARVRATDGHWQRGRITAQSGSIITLSSNVVSATGLRYEVGGLPMLVTVWPLSGDPRTPVLDMFRGKKVRAMGAALGNVSRTPTGDNDKLSYQLFERDPDPVSARDASPSDLTEVEGAVDGDTCQATYASIARNASILVPGVECWASNLDYDLLGLIVEGTLEKSKRDFQAT